MDKYIYRAKLDRVVDGDTVDALIDVGFDIWFKKRIRFMGLDTWESRTRDLEEKKLGKLAKERTRQLLEDVSSKSGYFRNVNKTLIAEGHAYVYDGGKKKVFTS